MKHSHWRYYGVVLDIQLGYFEKAGELSLIGVLFLVADLKNYSKGTVSFKKVPLFPYNSTIDCHPSPGNSILKLQVLLATPSPCGNSAHA